MAEKPINNSTIARIAGNLLSGNAEDWIFGGQRREQAVIEAVMVARAIAVEVERTTPKPDENEPF